MRIARVPKTCPYFAGLARSEFHTAASVFRKFTSSGLYRAAERIFASRNGAELILEQLPPTGMTIAAIPAEIN